jgi:hypothetical protein
MLGPAASRQRLNDRLAEARRRRFVGREAQLALFTSMLGGDAETPVLLFVHGPGGIGKTTLLDALQRRAREHGARPLLIDGRAISPSPDAFLQAMRQALELPHQVDPVDELSFIGSAALFIDTYELLAPLDAWLRGTLLPSLPDGVVTVIAGRNPPAAEWRGDPGWNALAAVVPLRNLSPEEGSSYLAQRNVPVEQHQRVLTVTHGHPLALSLVADVYHQSGDAVDDATLDRPDIVGLLLDRFCRHVPDRRHLRALQIAAQARVTTEDLLRDVLGGDDARELFEWLRGLSFIEEGLHGLYPHDLARDVIDRDLRWRSPDVVLKDHGVIRDSIVKTIQRVHDPESQRATLDLLYLHRHQPVMKPFVEWTVSGTAWIEQARPDDLPILHGLTERFEGPRAAALVDFWFGLQPEGFSVFRTGKRRTIGFITHFTIPYDRGETIADPAVAAIWEIVDREGPLRGDEIVRVIRFAVPDVDLQQDPFWGLVMLSSTMDWLTTQKPGWSFVVIPNPEQVSGILNYARFYRRPAPGLCADGPLAVFGHDWRAEPQLLWFERVAAQELAEPFTPQGPQPAPLLVLSEPQFREAARDALKNVNRPNRLASNPLLRSRLVLQRGEGTAATLQALLHEAANTLTREPRDRKFALALERGAFKPAATQELAAESLGLPFSTYRSHLTSAIQRVTDYLWQLELESSDL